MNKLKNSIDEEIKKKTILVKIKKNEGEYAEEL